MTCILVQWVMWVSLLYIFGTWGWGPTPVAGNWRWGCFILFFLLLLVGVLCLLGVGGSAPALRHLG